MDFKKGVFFVILIFLAQSAVAQEMPDYIKEIEDATNLSFTGAKDIPPESKGEDNVNLEEIQGTLWTMALAFILLLIVGAIVNLYRVHPAVLLVFLAVVVFLFGMFSTMVMKQDTYFSRFFESEWKNFSIDDFKMNELNDIELREEEKISRIISEYMDIPEEANSSIADVRSYYWETSSKSRRVVVMEFAERRDLSKFIDNYLSSLKRLYVSDETIFKTDPNMFNFEQYSDAYYFEQDRFLFLVMGEQELAEEAIQKIVSEYPTVKKSNDRSSPEIIAINPKDNSFTNTNEIIFEVKDDSGIDLNSIELRKVQDFVPSRACSAITAGYRCRYAKQELYPGKNSYTVSVKDRAGNKEQRTVHFMYDLLPPKVEHLDPNDYSYFKGRTITFSGIELESELDIESSSIVISGKHSNLAELCITDRREIECSIDVSSMLDEGINKIVLRLKDVAGNTQTVTRNFYYDISPPEIEYLEPSKTDKYKNDRVIQLVVRDPISGIDDVFVTGIIGFSRQDCLENTPNEYYCSFLGELTEGINSFNIQVSDNAGNSDEETLNFVFDITEPIIELTSPTITNEDVVKFEIVDLVSPIDYDYAEVDIDGFLSLRDNCLATQNELSCTVLPEFKEGLNRISVQVRDSAENYALLEQEIIYDITAPGIKNFRLIENDIITFELEDSNEIESITVGGATGFDREDDCSITDGVMYCSFIMQRQESDIISLTVVDEAGNTNQKSITI